jgi:hypothetical protein
MEWEWMMKTVVIDIKKQSIGINFNFYYNINIWEILTIYIII